MVALELVQDRGHIRGGGHRVAVGLQFPPDELLLDKAFRGSAFRGRAEIRRLPIEERGDADFAVQIAGRDYAVAHGNRNAVDDFAVQREEERKRQEDPQMAAATAL